MTDASDLKQRWKEYIEWLLNVDDGRRIELTGGWPWGNA